MPQLLLPLLPNYPIVTTDYLTDDELLFRECIEGLDKYYRGQTRTIIIGELIAVLHEAYNDIQLTTDIGNSKNVDRIRGEIIELMVDITTQHPEFNSLTRNTQRLKENKIMDNDTLKSLLSPREKFISAFKGLVLLGEKLESDMNAQDQAKLEKLINNCFATVDLDQDDIIEEYQRCLDVTVGTIWSNYRIELKLQAEQYSICITETIENTRLLDTVRYYE